MRRDLARDGDADAGRPPAPPRTSAPGTGVWHRTVIGARLGFPRAAPETPARWPRAGGQLAGGGGTRRPDSPPPWWSPAAQGRPLTCSRSPPGSSLDMRLLPPRTGLRPPRRLRSDPPRVCPGDRFTFISAVPRVWRRTAEELISGRLK